MPRGDRSSATRNALLRAGAKVFVERGPFGARVREIAREAGLTVPALYYHFEGTGALYGEVIQDGRARFEALIQEALATDGSVRDRLAAVARSYFAFGREDPVRLRLLCVEMFRPRETEEPDGTVEALRGWLHTSVEAVIAAGIGTGELAPTDVGIARRLFVGLLNGLLLEQADAPGAPLLDPRVAEDAVDMFVRGLGGSRA
jgi:AcrR family transcriptional regulator